MKRLNFLCPGFMKCGTTTLHEILNQHPDIYLPKIKETQYYYSDVYNRGFQWYLKRYYSGVKNESRIGEINPNLGSRYYEDKIANDFSPDTKIIFIVRNPVTRLFSHYKFSLRYGRSFNNINLCIKYRNNHREGFDRLIQESFIKKSDGKIELVPSIMNEIIKIGEYYSHIKAFMDYFPSDNIKIVLFEEFIKDIEFTTKQIFDFLGVNPNVKINYNIIANEGNLVPKNINSIYLFQMLFELRNQIHKFKYDIADQFMLNFQEIVQRKLILAPDNDKTGMSIEARKFLENYYRDEKQKMELLLERDLSGIWFK